MPTDERARLLADVIDSLDLGIAVWTLDDPGSDASLRLVFANRAADWHGSPTLHGKVGQRIEELFPPAPPDYIAALAAVCRSREPKTLKALGRGRSLMPVLDRGVCVLTQQAGAESLNAFLDSIIEHIPAMIFIKDARELRFERFNRAGEELLGLPREKLIGKTDYDFFPVAQADAFTSKDRAVLNDRHLADIVEEPIETPKGTRWLHTKKIPLLDEMGEPEHLLGISLDITERKLAEVVLWTSHDELEQRVVERTTALRKEIDDRERAETALARTQEQLRQTQKMEAIGLLAGGIAHDFNNFLSVILTYASLLGSSFPDNSSARKGLKEIRRAAQSAAELTKQLLAYSRQQVLQPVVLDVASLVWSMRDMLARIIGEDIELVVETGMTSHKVKCDPHQLEQVMMNLVVNARDAMPSGGRLTIRTGDVDLDATYVQNHLDASVGPHVVITVADTGVGIAEDVLPRIFDPFFTTKEKAKGTGLGLSMVLGSVRQAGGSIDVQSEVGKGTTFRLYWPASNEDESRRSLPPSIDTGGSETILLVEDHAQLRTVTASVLRDYGYTVIEAARPSEALAAVASNPSIDLLLSDVVMPEMNGRMLAEEIKRVHSEIRVILMSGYTDDAVVRAGVLESAVAFLQKPVTPEVLTRRIREVLDAPE